MTEEINAPNTTEEQIEQETNKEDYKRPSDMSIEKYRELLSELRGFGMDRIYVVFNSKNKIITTTFNTSRAGELEEQYDGHVELYNLD